MLSYITIWTFLYIILDSNPPSNCLHAYAHHNLAVVRAFDSRHSVLGMIYIFLGGELYKARLAERYIIEIIIRERKTFLYHKPTKNSGLPGGHFFPEGTLVKSYLASTYYNAKKSLDYQCLRGATLEEPWEGASLQIQFRVRFFV
jgi:hypothetical protein